MNPSGFADLLNTSTIASDQSIIYQLILPNLDPNSVPYVDIDYTVQDRVLNNGQLLMGVTGGPPVAASLTGTTNQVMLQMEQAQLHCQHPKILLQLQTQYLIISQFQ